VPTVGSIEHVSGNCKPCAFYYKQGCENGVQCKFCHLCEAGEKRRRQKDKKTQFRQSAKEQEVDQQGDVITSLSSQQLESLSSPATERLPRPPALDLQDDLDVAMPIATPQQPWPKTPSECWSPTPSYTNMSGVNVGPSMYLESWELGAAMFFTPFVVPPVEEAPWLWPAMLPPAPPASLGMTCASPLDYLTPPTCEAALVPNSSSVLRLADTIQEPELGAAEAPNVGSMNHRFGTCKPCAYLHKQGGCSNGADCPFCHLCEAGEKKKRQKIKKGQVQSMKREAETATPIGAVSCRVPYGGMRLLSSAC